MKIREVLQNEMVDFNGIETSYFLIGLLSAFNNRFQAFADKMIEEISWKQFFAIICINLCKESPTINDLAHIMGSSHQNVKQILLKLEKKGFIAMITDSLDKRKQRIILTEYCKTYCQNGDNSSNEVMNKMFNGLSQEELMITIQTIIKIEDNLMNINKLGNDNEKGI